MSESQEITQAKKKIERALTDLVITQPFWAVLAFSLKEIYTYSMPTFATDGDNLYVNPTFCNRQTHGAIKTIIAHEIGHCAFGHLWRHPPDHDHFKWNIAIDHEINLMLDDENNSTNKSTWEWPDVEIIKSEKYRGIAAEIIYKQLDDDPDYQKMCKPSNVKGELSNEEGDPSNQQGNPKNDQGGSFGDVIIDPAKTKGMEEQWEDKIIKAYEACKNQGFIPSSIVERIDQIKNPKVDWKSEIRDSLHTYMCPNDWTFSKRNRRYGETEVIMPSMFGTRAGTIVFVMDTSGSIYSELASQYISEAQSALDELMPERLIFIQADAEVQDVKIYEPGESIDMEILGRGGTDFRPAFDYINRIQDSEVKIVVYLTDLYGTFPSTEPYYPVLFVTDSQGQSAPFGRTIYL